MKNIHNFALRIITKLLLIPIAFKSNRLDGLLQEMNTTLGSPMSDKARGKGARFAMNFWATKEERKTMG